VTQTPPEQVPAAPQLTQLFPPTPHAEARPPCRHVPEASQQPVGHVAGPQASGWHAPPTQTSVGAQTTHWPPGTPQRLGGGFSPMQVSPRQHVPQLVGPQAAVVHACVVGLQTSPSPEQASQALPPVPQAALSFPPTHISPPPPLGWQQPLGQFAALQPTGTPWHVCEPGSHVGSPAAGQSSHA